MSGYMINVPITLNHKSIYRAIVAAHLNHAGKLYSIGMRPIIFWCRWRSGCRTAFMLVSTILFDRSVVQN